MWLTFSRNKAIVHCRFRPQQLFLYGLVWSRRLPSTRTRLNQHDATTGALACARPCNDVTRCNGIDMFPCGSLCSNMTLSSLKPEVYRLSQSSQTRTESWTQVTQPKTLVVKIGYVVPEMNSRTQTHKQTSRHTDALIAILRWRTTLMRLFVLRSHLPRNCTD